MRVLEVQLENDLYDTLAAEAESRGTSCGELVALVVGEWVEQRLREREEKEWETRRLYLKLRVQKQEQERIAERLKIPVERLREWDQRIRSDPAQWSKAYFALKKSVDPLMWEMTFRNRFRDLWGEKPS